MSENMSTHSKKRRNLILDFPLKASHTIGLGVVACTCNPATLEAEFWNGVSLLSVGGNSPLIGGVNCVTTCNPALGEEPG